MMVAMGSSQQIPVSDATQEVRFATAMTGGVSLAIWMGGVARELNLLDQASRARQKAETVAPESLDPADREVRERYGALLDLLDVVIRVDVLSGTSAGGINAALLAMCHATGWDLGWLRDVWLNAGDLELLLRDPATKDPPSLLRGDGVLLAQLEENIKRPDMPAVEEARSTTVHITTTLLEGETSRFTDSYGTLVPDVNHLGVFRFTQDDLRSEEGRCALALAARSSASFPAAFEPAFLPYGEAVKAVGRDVGPTQRPAMSPFLSITRSHWAADGGLLANRPIRPILDSIFEQPSLGRQVRRALLYIVPDPGGTPRPVDDPEPARIEQPLALPRALLGDMTSALNQSIAAELTAIQQHNERVDAMRDSRLRLAELGVAVTAAAPASDPFPTDGAWNDYVSRQGQWVVRPLVRAVMATLSTMPSNEMPVSWKAELATGNAIENTCCNAASKEVTDSWHRPSPGATPADLATLGRLAYDGVKGIVVSLVQLGYATNPPADLRGELAGLGQGVHAAFRPEDREPPQAMVTRLVSEAAKQENPPSLVDLAKRVAVAWVDEQNAGDNDTGAEPPPTATEGLPAGWELLQRVLAELVPKLTAVATGGPTTSTPAVVAARKKLSTYLAYLGPDSAAWVGRLVGLHIMDRSILPVAVEVDQKVELIQVSATTRTLLDPARNTPATKLTGTQFHHFGAFYKASWRANDWMWGRLDGAGWLVHVLLDPRRIRTVVDADEKTYPRNQSRAEAFLGQLLDRTCSTIDRSSEQAKNIVKELAFLDGSDDPPLSLPETALWLAQTWQRAIVASELPVVAREALAAPTKRDQTWAVNVLQQAGRPDLAEAASRQAVARVAAGHTARMTRKDMLDREQATAPTPEPGVATKPPDTASTSPLLQQSTASIAALLQSCPVPQQTLGHERGEPLFTRTVAKATAVATAAATAVQKPPATINTVFRTARTTTLTGYRAANAVGFWPRRLIAVGAGIAAVGVLLAAQGSTILGFTGVALLLAGLYLVAFGVWSTSPRIIGALVAVTLVAGVFALTIPLTRRVLFGTADGTEKGWVDEHLVPWMRDRWWALVVILVLIILVPAAASFVGRWLAERRRDEATKRELSRTST
jgi:patatin-related protein